MINFNVLLSKELKDPFRDRRAMLSDVSPMMIRSSTSLVKYLAKGVAK